MLSAPPFYPLNIDKCSLATLTNISQIYYAKSLRLRAAETVPETFEGKKIGVHSWAVVRRLRHGGRGRGRRRHGEEKPLHRFLGGRALLISFISRSTSYAVLSRMKTKACKRNFSSFFLRARFITTLPFSLTTLPLNYIHGAN